MTTAGRILARTVFIDDQRYDPGHVVTEEQAKRITNPKAYAPEEPADAGKQEPADAGKQEPAKQEDNAAAGAELARKAQKAAAAPATRR